MMESSESIFFSVITVVRNDFDGLIKTSNSISLQDFASYQWIVIDGASTDETISFLKNSDSKFLKWISESDKGIYDAMNKGIKNSAGHYIVFLNAGDVFPDKSTLSSIYTKLVGDNFPDVLLGGAMLLLPSLKSIYRAPKDLSSYIWHGLPSNHQATYYKNEVLSNTLYDISYRITGDYYLIANLYKKGISSCIFNKSLVNFRVGDLSFQNPLQLLRESNKVQKQVLKLGLPTRIFSTSKKILAISFLYLLAKKYIPNIFFSSK